MHYDYEHLSSFVNSFRHIGTKLHKSSTLTNLPKKGWTAQKPEYLVQISNEWQNAAISNVLCIFDVLLFLYCAFFYRVASNINGQKTMIKNNNNWKDAQCTQSLAKKNCNGNKLIKPKWKTGIYEVKSVISKHFFRSLQLSNKPIY